ncbi:potassium/proton antiporter (CPA1 family) [Salsuginibacillus halophilus]|uniref:Potassium/proton antiporter (CPA1 family) n=1 Tax=Salsuginibacillus halophilus TaxID=517424 RepID=A0A2P8H9V5_9BACI|nr:potassium/proton antiporter [Salsuginibacillus halophilus]PSL42970.1 potassium/proton antiporter (CPA1 family) [Salsuginibacillus halophilus]
MLTEHLLSDYFMIILGAALLCGVIITKFSSRLGVPSLVLFIALGMLMGSDAYGFIDVRSLEEVQIVGIIALVIILFEGGLHTNWTTIRPVIGTAVSLATVTVFLTSAVLALFAYLILDLSMLEAMLLGALVGSTDAAAVFATLKGKPINERLGATMEGEAGANDPMAVFLTLAAIELLLDTSSSPAFMIGSFFWQMLAGAGLGLLIGWMASQAINRINLDATGLYPIFTLAVALVTYSVTEFVFASGFLAVYVCALVIGNSPLTHRYTISRFHEGLAWVSQIVMFVILGLVVIPGEIFSWSIIWTGLLLSMILMFVARPLAVFLSTLGMGYNLQERIFLSWAGLRGAVPIVLAIFPIVAGVEVAEELFHVVFFIVLTSAVLQGATMTPAAEKLGVTGPKKDMPHYSFELVNIGRADAKFVEFYAAPYTPAVGHKAGDLPLPEGAEVNALLRGDDLINVTEETVIEPNDFLYILVPKHKQQEVKKVLLPKKNKGD